MARVEAATRRGLVIDYIVTARFVKRHAKSTKLVSGRSLYQQCWM